MHIFSGVISQAVSCGMYGASGATEVKGIRTIFKEDREKLVAKLPKICAVSALVFAAQMLDFNIIGTNTSGHIVGGLLLALLFGADIGYFSLSLILILQCLVFGDGGIMELGCNIWNMAFYGCYIGSKIVKSLSGKEQSGLRRYAATLAGSIICLELGAITTIVEFAISGSLSITIESSVLTLLPLYLVIGVVEGTVTYGVVMVYEILEQKDKSELIVLISSVSSLVIAGVLSVLASNKMDGIDVIAGSGQYHYGAGLVNVVARISVLSDYQVNGISNSLLTRGAAGVAGILMVAVITYLSFQILAVSEKGERTFVTKC